MSSFTRDLIIRWLPEQMKFKVFISFKYYVGNEDSDDFVSVPEGYITDLASIPPVARWLIPKLGRHAQAAVLHDFIYQYHTYSRKKCDRVFLEAMEVLNVPLWKRRVMYRAVRMFGWLSWSRK